MANTQAKLAQAVAGFMGRSPMAFVRGINEAGLLTSAGGDPIYSAGAEPIVVNETNTVDLLLQACNNARLYAERLLDLELAVDKVTIPCVSLLDGGSLSSAVLYGTTTPASVKKIMTPFLPLADGGLYPVELWDKKSWNGRLRRRYEGASPLDDSTFAQWSQAPLVVVQSGMTIFVAPADSTLLDSTFDIHLDCWLWLPPYINGTENDFLLDSCFDWMLYRCVYELNFFLKEDERVSLSTGLMKDAWDSVVKWNNELIKSTVDTVNLD